MKATKATPTVFAEDIVANAVVMPFEMEDQGSKNRASRNDWPKFVLAIVVGCGIPPL